MIIFNNCIFEIDSEYLWGILAIAILIFLIIGIVLQFHWKKYVTNLNSYRMIKTFFWFISFSIIILTTISLLVFELGI
jgi:hypothetical protein